MASLIIIYGYNSAAMFLWQFIYCSYSAIYTALTFGDSTTDLWSVHRCRFQTSHYCRGFGSGTRQIAIVIVMIDDDIHVSLAVVWYNRHWNLAIADGYRIQLAMKTLARGYLRIKQVGIHVVLSLSQAEQREGPVVSGQKIPSMIVPLGESSLIFRARLRPLKHFIV